MANPVPATEEPLPADYAGPDPRVVLQKRFLLGAFVVLAGVVLFFAAQLVNERSPEKRLERLRSVIGAVEVDMDFDPGLHDRELEVAPWDGRGKTTTLASKLAGGRVVFVNFWATWCKPCVQELPSMLRLAGALRKRDFEMVAISYDESWDDIQKFFEAVMGRMPSDITLLRDPQFEADPLRIKWGTDKLPETYILQGNRIADKFIAAHDWTEPGKLEYLELVLGLGGE